MNRPTPLAISFLFITIAFTVIGQLLVKKGMLEVGPSPGQMAALPGFFWRSFTNPSVAAGLACAVAAALAWTAAISRTDLSFAYPFMALAIVLVLVLSGVFFGEKVSAGRWIGAGVVCLGLWIASRG